MNEQINREDELKKHFSGLTKYWRNIYVDIPESHDFFYHHEAIKRKEAVLDSVDSISYKTGLKLLDAGCGAGVIMTNLLKKGHFVTGIELSEDMTNEARQNLKENGFHDAEILIESVERTQFNNELFDISLCIGVLQYLETDELAIKELSRITKKNGHIIISLPNILSLKMLFDPYYYLHRLPKFFWLKCFRSYNRQNKYTEDDIQKNLSFRNRRYSYFKIKKIAKKCGLKICAIHPIGFGPLTFWKKEYLPRNLVISTTNRIEKLAHRGAFSVLNIFANRWVILLEKIN